MRIFVTGASGWIGSAVVPELLRAGHEVVGLARSEASAQRLEAARAIVQRGDVDDPDGLAKAAADSDRPLVLASGMLGLKAGRVATEDDGLVPSAEVRASPAGRRSATALLTLSLAGTGVRSSVLRFPPTVHGDGDHGFVATLVGIARQRG